MLDVQRSRIEPDIDVVAISGQITLGRECQRVEWAIEELIREGGSRKVIFDLSNLAHVDSTGLGIILTCSGKVSATGGELRIAAVQPRVSELMRITKLDRIITFYSSAATAAEGF